MTSPAGRSRRTCAATTACTSGSASICPTSQRRPMPKSSSQLKTFEEADAALRALGEALRDKARLEIAAQKQIDSVKARLAENRIGPDAVVKSTTKLLGKFIEKHQADIEARGGKTVQLQFGRIGTRTAPPALKLDKGF